MRSHYDDRPFVCEESGCSAAFTRKDHLERHMLKHTPDKDKPFHCSICDKAVNSRQHLKRHERTHFKSFQCPFDNCPEAFYKHQSLKAHISQVHETNQEKHKCQFCHKRFLRPGRLRDHIEKQHNNESKLVCDYPGCFKTFKVWSALQLHIKSDHPRLECTICGKKVVGCGGLANHMQIHNTETVVKLWKCEEDQCHDKFLKKEDAVKHYALCHPTVDLPEILQYGGISNGNSSTCNMDTLAQVASLFAYSNADGDAKVEGSTLSSAPSSPASVSVPVTASVSTDELINFPVTPPNAKRATYSHLINTTQKSKRKRESSTWKNAPDTMDLLVNNVDTRLTCPYVSCRRLFTSKAHLSRHLSALHGDNLEDVAVEMGWATIKKDANFEPIPDETKKMKL